MMFRLFTIALALSIGAQALTGAGATMVCKYTGEVMKGCPCPHPDEPASAEVKDQGCCELRAPSAPVGPAVISASAPRPERPEFALLATTRGVPEMLPLIESINPARGRDPPPNQRIFVALRHLLI